MNFTEFIKKVDQASGSMPPENLAAFLHDYARSVPEHRREEFLERLFSFGNRNVGVDDTRRQESRGEQDGKARTMEGYRSEYSRRSAFHQELRAFGMRDTRKKR